MKPDAAVSLPAPEGYEHWITMTDASGRVTQDWSRARRGEAWLCDERGICISRDYIVFPENDPDED